MSPGNAPGCREGAVDATRENRRVIEIAEDDPRRADVVELIEEHLADMRAWSPPESVHALDLAGLVAPGMTFWTAREAQPDGLLLGTAALKELGGGAGELKSMRTPLSARGRGAAKALLEHAIATASARGYAELYLETGSQPEFLPARSLYLRRGFLECAPFGDYLLDPGSTFMRLGLTERF